MREWAAFTVVLFLVGCASTPTTYLQLSATSAPQRLPVAGSPISVDHVQMPATIDRLYLTSATGPTTLTVARHARWAAPLDGMATQVLATDLAERIGGATVLMPGDQTPPGPTCQVRVNVTRFLPVIPRSGQAHVVLDADWWVVNPNGLVRHTGQSRVRVASGGTPASEAKAMSIALGRLADAITRAIASGS